MSWSATATITMTTSGTSSRYGSENFAREFRDLQATTMSVDRTAQHALLAGRKYLAVIGLEQPASDKLLYRLAYGGKYEISITQWSKVENSPNSVAIASSQRCDIFELTDGAELKCLHRLKGHTRVITDLDWCPLQANLLATCSFDSYVNIWDIRSPRGNSEKPQFSLSALDGASQVKWNKVEQDILASCDGGHVKIWDLRKPNAPTEYIAAHASKINGLEWANRDTIITAAQDSTVKFSGLAAYNPSKTRGPVLSLNAPVWRARPAPFGRGIVTQCVPILRRDSGLLTLWDWRRFSSPVYTFQAHDIVEFAWKKDEKENFELLTWSRDQTLRMWTLPYEIVELCGGGDENRPPNHLNASCEDSATEAGIDMMGDDEESPEGSPRPERPPTAMSRHALNKKERSSLERRSRKSSSPTPVTKRDEILMNEYDLVLNEKPETITFDQVELERGLLRFSWVGKSEKGRSSSVTAGVLVSFPLGYPAASPTFLVTNSSNEVDKNQILKSLRNVAQQNAKRNETCLLACINMFVSIMQSIKTLDADSATEFPTIGVSNVPFPRTSGARFCSVGMLVCFGRPTYLRRIKSNTDSGTPRSLSALGPFLSQLAHEEDGRSRRSRRLEKKKANIVTVFDVTSMLPFSRHLGESYTHIISNPSMRKMACTTNANTARNNKKPGVANTWQAASIVAEFSNEYLGLNSRHQHQQLQPVHDMQMPDEDDDEASWISHHPLGSDLIHSMITHYAKHGDVQTSGTMACLFTQVDSSSFNVRSNFNERANNGESQKQISNQNKHLKPPRLTVVPKWWTKGVGSPYHTVHGSDTLHGVVVNPMTDNYFRQHRSNSWSDSLDDVKNLTQSMYDGTMVISNGNGVAGPGGGGGLMSSSGFMVMSQGQMNGSHHDGLSSSGIGTSIITNSTTSNSTTTMNGRNGGGGLGNTMNLMMTSISNGSISIKDLDLTMTMSMEGSAADEKPLLPIPRGYILNPGLNSLYDCYKKSYAEILYRWGLLQQRAEVLKTLTLITENHMIIRAGVDFSVQCRNCHQIAKGPFCQQCKRVASQCAICHLPARGLSTFCSACGHGGHSTHMLNWFKTKKTCATGCGCHCVRENTLLFK